MTPTAPLCPWPYRTAQKPHYNMWFGHRKDMGSMKSCCNECHLGPATPVETAVN